MGAGYTLHSHVFGALSAEWVLTSRLPSRWPRPSPLARSSLSRALWEAWSCGRTWLLPLGAVGGEPGYGLERRTLCFSTTMHSKQPLLKLFEDDLQCVVLIHAQSAESICYSD